MSDSIAKLLAKIKPAIDAVMATTRTHSMWWMGGAGAVVVAVAVAIVVFGGFFGPGGKVICTATLAQAKDFGVIPMSASLTGNSARSTDVKNRRECAAQADGDAYRLVVDVKPDDKVCKDMKGPDCIRLYTVARTDGMVTYQVREIPPEESDAAIEAREAQGDTGADAGGPGGADTGGPGGADTDTSGLGSVAPSDNPGEAQAGSADSLGGGSNDQQGQQ